jgi:hypothetical protein
MNAKQRRMGILFLLLLILFSLDAFAASKCPPWVQADPSVYCVFNYTVGNMTNGTNCNATGSCAPNVAYMNYNNLGNFSVNRVTHNIFTAREIPNAIGNGITLEGIGVGTPDMPYHSFMTGRANLSFLGPGFYIYGTFLTYNSSDPFNIGDGHLLALVDLAQDLPSVQLEIDNTGLTLGSESDPPLFNPANGTSIKILRQDQNGEYNNPIFLIDNYSKHDTTWGGDTFDNTPDLYVIEGDSSGGEIFLQDESENTLCHYDNGFWDCVGGYLINGTPINNMSDDGDWIRSGNTLTANGSEVVINDTLFLAERFVFSPKNNLFGNNTLTIHNNLSGVVSTNIMILSPTYNTSEDTAQLQLVSLQDGINSSIFTLGSGATGAYITTSSSGSLATKSIEITTTPNDNQLYLSEDGYIGMSTERPITNLHIEGGHVAQYGLLFLNSTSNSAFVSLESDENFNQGLVFRSRNNTDNSTVNRWLIFNRGTDATQDLAFFNDNGELFKLLAGGGFVAHGIGNVTQDLIVNESRVCTGSNSICPGVNITGSIYLTNASGVLDVNESKLNATINALEHNTSLPYLYNDSTTIFFNETKLNTTIQALDTNCSVAGSCSNVAYMNYANGEKDFNTSGTINLGGGGSSIAIRTTPDFNFPIQTYSPSGASTWRLRIGNNNVTIYSTDNAAAGINAQGQTRFGLGLNDADPRMLSIYPTGDVAFSSGNLGTGFFYANASSGNICVDMSGNIANCTHAITLSNVSNENGRIKANDYETYSNEDLKTEIHAFNNTDLENVYSAMEDLKLSSYKFKDQPRSLRYDDLDNVTRLNYTRDLEGYALNASGQRIVVDEGKSDNITRFGFILNDAVEQVVCGVNGTRTGICLYALAGYTLTNTLAVYKKTKQQDAVIQELVYNTTLFNDRMGSMEANISVLDTTAASLKTNMTGLQSTIASLQQNITRMNQTIAAQQATIATLNTRLTAIENLLNII